MPKYPLRLKTLRKAISNGEIQFVDDFDFYLYQPFPTPTLTLDTVAPLLKMAVKKGNLKVYQALRNKLPSKHYDRYCLEIALNHLYFNCSSFQHFFPMNMPRSLDRLYLDNDHLTLSFIRKCLQFGFQIGHVGSKVRKIEQIIRRKLKILSGQITRAKRLQLQLDIKKLIQLTTFFVVHGELSPIGFYNFAYSALITGHFPLFDIYLSYTKDITTFTQELYKRATPKLWNQFGWFIKSKSLRNFVNRQTTCGGTIDTLLYAPPRGIMIHRSLRICEISI